MMYTDSPAVNDDYSLAIEMIKEKLELANADNLHLRTQVAKLKEKYEGVKARYNDWWNQLETWTKKQTKKICIVCAKERPLSSPVPLMATHLIESTQQWCVSATAVTPLVSAPAVTPANAATATHQIESTFTPANVTSNPHIAIASGNTARSGTKRPLNATNECERPLNAAEWQEFCRGYPEIWSSPGKIQRWMDEYDRTH